MAGMKAGLSLLGGLSAEVFMQRHWQRHPWLIRGTQEASFLDRRALFALAARDDVESRLVVREGTDWRLTQGPIRARTRPPLSQPNWSLLVQGVDLHLDAAHRLLARFGFASWARVDDVMVSFATDGGGVGAHTDEYDVFLLQLEGRRRWRVGPAPQPRWRRGTPLKLLANFVATLDWVLEPGDMLYVPPGWGHDGVGVGPACITASVGFRSPRAGELVRELMSRLADDNPDDTGVADDPRYRDPRVGPSSTPGLIASSLGDFARKNLRRALVDEQIALVLGEWLTEPKPQVWFDALSRSSERGESWWRAGLRLDRRSRMLYDERAIYLNGESFLARGHDARLLRKLADQRWLDAKSCRLFTRTAGDTIDGWVAAGWVVAVESGEEDTPASSSRSRKSPR
jgi:50S ribosomal protein L16 3-hydroxylase